MLAASTVLMVRPAAFGFNSQTAADNSFQRELKKISTKELNRRVLKEFDGMIKKLRLHKVDVIEIADVPEPVKSDAVFPNNWFCTLPGGSIDVFPMYATSRRPEKRVEIIQQLTSNYKLTRVTDWTELEAEGFFLEGTGSMVMDHQHRIIYACRSQRTHPAALEKFATMHQYRAVLFEANDDKGLPIYHTNVLMCIGNGFALVGADCFSDEMDWIAVSQLLRTTDHEVIVLSMEQVKAFAGNMLQVRNKEGEYLLVMSKTAYDSLSPAIRKKLKVFTKLLAVAIPTIETIGGGSARCMMAEIFSA